MKVFFVTTLISVSSIFSSNLSAQQSTTNALSNPETAKHLYLDVHQFEPGKVKFKDVAAAHAKDIATQSKYGANFLKFWVDEKKGMVYCLVSASNIESIRKTHAEAHGLMPVNIYEVTDGGEVALNGNDNLFLDVHYLGAGKVTAKDAAAVHQKDLAVQKKYGVNLINYWVDEKQGVVMCLAQAKDSASLVNTHKEAHGLLPTYVMKVKQGQ